MSTLKQLSVAVVSVLWASAVGCGEPEPDPCETDIFGCVEAPDYFEYDDECTLSGELDVELGWGEQRFRTFEEQPEIVYGFQGGQHISWALRVPNADVQNHELLRISIRTYSAMTTAACEEALAYAREWAPDDLPLALREDDSLGPEPELPIFVDGGDEDERLPIVGDTRCLRRGSDRTLVLGALDPIRTGADGVEEYGIQVQVGSGPHLLATIEVEDPCRREGFDLAVITP